MHKALSKMYEAKKFTALKDSQKQVFEIIKTFIENYEDKGYLSFDAQYSNSIDLTVGVRKFTIKSEILLPKKRIHFSVYSWVFDLSKEIRHKPEDASELNFFKAETDRINFFTSKKDDYGNEFVLLCILNEKNTEILAELLLAQLEKFTDNQQKVYNEGINKALGF